MEAFNALNHPNFGAPFRDISAPNTFGTITNTVSAPRTVELVAKLYFWTIGVTAGMAPSRLTPVGPFTRRSTECSRLTSAVTRAAMWRIHSRWTWTTAQRRPSARVDVPMRRSR